MSHEPIGPTARRHQGRAVALAFSAWPPPDAAATPGHRAVAELLEAACDRLAREVSS